MNAKPILIFSAIAAASMGAMATAYVVEQRNVAVRVVEVPAPKTEAPKAEVKIAVIETPKAAEVPKVAEASKTVVITKTPETPKLVDLPKAADVPKVVEVPKAGQEPQVAVAAPVEKLAEKTVPDVVVSTAPVALAPVVLAPVDPVPVEPKVVVEPKLPEESGVAVRTEQSPLTPNVNAEAALVPPVVENSLPAFDTVRVEATGDAVIAGRADPGSEVTIKWNGKLVGKTIANSDGSFVLVPEKPMKKGIGALTIEMSKNGQVVQSEGSVIVAVKENAPALVAKIDPIAPTTVLQVPAANDAPPTGEVQLNAVDYDTAGNIVFSGRAKPGHIIRFYVDNKLSGEIATTENGLWVFRGDERVTSGQHMLRADAVDTKGKVQSRIELPFLRETAEVVAAAKIATTETIIEKTLATPTAEDTTVASVEKKRSITIEKSVVDEPQLAAPVEPPQLETPVVEPQIAIAGDTPLTTDATVALKLNPQKLVIQPGNNLWKLSREIYGKGRMFTVIYEANRDQVKNPNKIYPGQILTAPQQN